MASLGTKKNPIKLSRATLEQALRTLSERFDAEPSEYVRLADTVHFRVHEGWLEVTAPLVAKHALLGWGRVRLIEVKSDAAFGGVVAIDELRAIVDPHSGPAHETLQLWRESRGNRETLRFLRSGLEVACAEMSDRLNDNEQYTCNLIDTAGPESDSTLELPDDLLAPAIELTKWAMADQRYRYSLNALQVRICEGPEGALLTICGSDGKHLSVVKVAPLDRMPFPKITPRWPLGMMLAAETAGFLLRIARSDWADHTIKLTPLAEGKMVRIESGGFTAVHHTISGQYPQWDQVVPSAEDQRRHYTTTLKAPVGALRAAWKAVLEFSTEEVPHVLLEATDQKLRVVQQRGLSWMVCEMSCVIEGERNGGGEGGEPIRVALDPEYVEGALKAMRAACLDERGSDLPICVRDADSAVIWSVPVQSGVEWFYLVMPVEGADEKRGTLDKLIFAE